MCAVRNMSQFLCVRVVPTPQQLACILDEECRTSFSSHACRMSQQLDALGRDAAGSNQQPGAEDMTGLVDGIMQQLLAKDVLYQPIQEIGARYPQWLADHRC